LSCFPLFCKPEIISFLQVSYILLAIFIALAAIVRAADNYNHPIGVHKLSGLAFDEFADDPNIDQFTIQYNEADPAVLNDGMVEAWTTAAGRYNLNMSESRFHVTGSEARHRHWAIAMGGAYVMVLSMDIINTPRSDLEDLGRLAEFMESTDFPAMAPMNELATAATLYVLANPGRSYIAYGHGLTADDALGLRDLSSGSYALRWFDPANGRDTMEQIELPGGDHKFPLPDGWQGEAALHLTRTDAIDGARLTARDLRIVARAETAVDIDLSAAGTRAEDLEYRVVRPPSSGSLGGSGRTRR